MKHFKSVFFVKF